MIQVLLFVDNLIVFFDGRMKKNNGARGLNNGDKDENTVNSHG